MLPLGRPIFNTISAAYILGAPKRPARKGNEVRQLRK
jgi:hypothetical protein